MQSKFFKSSSRGTHWRIDKHIDIANRWIVAECVPIGNADHNWEDRFYLYASSKDEAYKQALSRIERN